MALLAAGGMGLSVWIALRWGPAWQTTFGEWFHPGWWNRAIFDSFSPAWLAAVLFSIPLAVLLALAFRPAIEIHQTCLKAGAREIPWDQIRRVDRTGWQVPLAVYLTLENHARVLIVHAGDAASCSTLLRYIRRHARRALLDGVPYRQFWGEPPAPEWKRLEPPRYQLVRPEEEEEVERMFQRLKSVGHLDQRGSDEK
jgi:hypothetical protein